MSVSLTVGRTMLSALDLCGEGGDAYCLGATVTLRLYGSVKLPMLAYCRPVVSALDAEHCIVRIDLNRRTRNHLGVLYIAAYTVGADCAGALLAVRSIMRSGVEVDLLFRDFRAEYRRPGTGDVYFRCDDGLLVAQAVARAVETGTRVSQAVEVTATVPSVNPRRVIARMGLTINLRRRPQHGVAPESSTMRSRNSNRPTWLRRLTMMM